MLFTFWPFWDIFLIFLLWLFFDFYLRMAQWINLRFVFILKWIEKFFLFLIKNRCTYWSTFGWDIKNTTNCYFVGRFWWWRIFEIKWKEIFWCIWMKINFLEAFEWGFVIFALKFRLTSNFLENFLTENAAHTFSWAYYCSFKGFEV